MVYLMKWDNIVCNIFDVNSIEGLLVIFWFWCVLFNDCWSCFVRFGLILVFLLFVFWSDWCNICFNLGVKVMIGIFEDILMVFWMISLCSEICIVVVSILGFWLCGLYLIRVCIIECILWIVIFLFSKFCSIFMIVVSGNMLGISFLIKWGWFFVNIFNKFCIFLWLSSNVVLLVSNWLIWVVIIVVELIMV